MTQAQVKAPWPGWEVSDYLGGGSFGAVYKIQREISGETEYAAMKVISVPKEPGEARDLLSSGYDLQNINQRYRTDLEDIRKEYGMMALLKGNANIVYCDDIYDEPNPDGIGWKLYIRMELLTPLTKALAEPFSEAQVIRVGMDLCNALVACRRKSIVHRDIKPSNIMVAEDGNYKLGDFGVAKKLEGTSGGTKTGTYSFMAPEVYNNRPYGQSADIYSLGMVLYWMLNRRCAPFLPLPPTVPTASRMEEAKDRRFRGEQLPPPENGSQELKQIVLRACAFDPAQRYTAPEKLYADLSAIARTMPAEQVAPVTSAAKSPDSCPDDRTTSLGNEYYQTQSDRSLKSSAVFEGTAKAPGKNAPVKQKNKWIALLLAIFPYTGLFGVHDFYLGYKKSGILKLCTLNFLGLGVLVDVIRILIGMYAPLLKDK